MKRCGYGEFFFGDVLCWGRMKRLLMVEIVVKMVLSRKFWLKLFGLLLYVMVMRVILMVVLI